MAVAAELLAGKRVLVTGAMPDAGAEGMTLRSLAGGYLLQSRDDAVTAAELKVVTRRAPTDAEMADLAFAFAVGGVGAALPALVAPWPEGPEARRRALEKPPGATLALPFVFWLPLTRAPLNPIHACLAALAAGLAVALWRRPDLALRCLAAGAAFTLYYALFLAALDLLAPGYFGRVWNPEAPWGPRPGGVPLEEPAFGFLFGAYGAAVHEQARWLEAGRGRRPTE